MTFRLGVVTLLTAASLVQAQDLSQSSSADNKTWDPQAALRAEKFVRAGLDPEEVLRR